MLPWIRSMSPIFSKHPLHHVAFASTRRFTWIRSLLDLAYHLLERFGHIYIQACASFRKTALELLRQFLSIFFRDMPLVGPQVALVSNNNQGNPVCTLSQVRKMRGDCGELGIEYIQDDQEFCPSESVPYQTIASMPPSRPTCSHVYR